jgi:uncharacterized membrane protein
MPAGRISGEVETAATAADLPIRLGAIAGLAAAGAAMGTAILFGGRTSVLAASLAALPLLLLALWLAALRAFQAPALVRLGNAGGWAAAIGVALIGMLNLLRAASLPTPGGSLGRLLDSEPLGIAVALAIVLLMWGILALGTASLRAGLLPRASVVLWMAGIAANLLTSWVPAGLTAIAGVFWSSVALLRARHPVDPIEESGSAAAPGATGRLLPLDVLRGTIMALMAIDHASLFVRRWHPFETWDQPLPDYPSLAAMLTRLASHPCAPGFYFLMGAGMLLFLHARRGGGWSDRRILGHLALRGLLFILLEQLVVDVATSGRVGPLDFSILAGLGGVMLLGIPFLRLAGKVQAVVGAAIILGMQILPGWLLHTDLGALSPIRLLLLPGSVGPAYVLYPPVPWLGVALLGMAFAGVLHTNPGRAYRLALAGGLASLALFVVLRSQGGFGNLRMPPGHSLIDFLNLVKYPPSLTFLLLTLGFDLVLLSLYARAVRGLAIIGRPLVTLGQAALYFFLVHWFVYAAMGSVFRAPGGLPATYLVWIIGLVSLYPICKAYEAFKHRMPAASVWRMI